MHPTKPKAYYTTYVFGVINITCFPLGNLNFIWNGSDNSSILYILIFLRSCYLYFWRSKAIDYITICFISSNYSSDYCPFSFRAPLLDRSYDSIFTFILLYYSYCALRIFRSSFNFLFSAVVKGLCRILGQIYESIALL